MFWAHVHAGSTPATRTKFQKLWCGSSVGQYERLITSKRRCKSCPRYQLYIYLFFLKKFSWLRVRVPSKRAFAASGRSDNFPSDNTVRKASRDIATFLRVVKILSFRSTAERYA